MTAAAHPPSATICVATPADAFALAGMHVAAWRETYAGLMPEAVLASLSVEERTARWQAILDQPHSHSGTDVFLAKRDERVVAFSSCGEQRTPNLRDQGFAAEISAIYVLQLAQRSGVGSALMARMARVLIGRGHKAASLWVLRENAPAQAFYKRLGGGVVSEKEERRGSATLIEVAYGWRDLNGLLAAAIPLQAD